MAEAAKFRENEQAWYHSKNDGKLEAYVKSVSASGTTAMVSIRPVPVAIEKLSKRPVEAPGEPAKKTDKDGRDEGDGSGQWRRTAWRVASRNGGDGVGQLQRAGEWRRFRRQ